MTTITAAQPPPQPWAHQSRALEFIRDKPGAMLAMEMGTGKDLDDNTPIATTEGWTRMGELQVGQQVFDERGQVCNVTRVFPQGERPVYDVAFDDGTVITAGHEHLWVTHSRRARTHKGRAARENWASQLMPITTQEIRESLVHQRGNLEESMHSIPTAMPLEMPEADLPLDPYILGLWLGDGPSRAPEITCHVDDEPHHREAVSAAGENWRPRNRTGNTLTCTMAGEPKPPMSTRLKSIGVLENKHIPHMYLRASVKQRTKLMLGLMDTDGYISPEAGTAQFVSTGERLAQDFLELALSLGQKATMTQGEAKLNGRVTSPKWSVQFSPTQQVTEAPEPFLQNPHERDLSRTDQRYIRDVTPSGTVTTTCITVDSPSGLFLAGCQMVPTHNTRVAIDHMEELEARRTLVLAPLSVVDHVWPREIRTHGRRLTTIISLGDKFPNVRAKLKQAAEGLALATARKGPAVVIVNYESACREPLAEWLKSIHWDLFVMDEAHRLKSPSGQISRFASQVADRSARRLALTGTPMPHSPLDIYAQYRAIDKRVYGVNYGAFKTRYAEFETVGKPITTVDEHGNEETRLPQAVSGYQNLDELNRKFYSLAFRVTAAETLDLPGAIETYTHVELGKKARRLYDQMAASFIAELETGEKITAANALARLVRFQQLTSGFAATPEGKIIEVDEAKAKALADILEDLPRREPVVIFVRFQNDLDAIARIAGKMKRPHYEISGRVKNLEEWNDHGGVLAVQIQAGGLGLDLTASRYCVYYSLGFSLGDYLQSIARLHRPGQTSMVDYIHLVAAASIDEIIVGALANKEDVVNRILETKDLTNGSLHRSR